MAIINNLRDIMSLIDKFNESDIDTLKLEIPGENVSLELGRHTKREPPSMAQSEPERIDQADAAQLASIFRAEPVAEGERITAPLIGTFYSSASPDSPPFVTPGTHVKKGAVLCIIEAMKVMNEIESEFTGVVREVCVKSGSAVEFGQTLFVIDT
ncbi:acetyl-CoA carboxylase, biotin carboxyl carrier protein [Clostridia bacterium]|nr:acetyl-CoA carboxylase, biotin carboxyl carrier protein [Clostridia bacterium]